MNAITGETTIAEKRNASQEKVSECLSKIMLASKHLLNLINDILDMSAIESNKQMPVMNGYEAATAIRSSTHPDATSVTIIAMTANAFAEDIEKSMESGMNDHLSKPIDTDVMYAVLARYLTK